MTRSIELSQASDYFPTNIPDSIFDNFLHSFVRKIEDEDIHGVALPDTYDEYVQAYIDIDRIVKQEEIRSL